MSLFVLYTSFCGFFRAIGHTHSLATALLSLYFFYVYCTQYNKAVSSNVSKLRKAHFTAPSSERRIIMSAPLSKELQTKYNVASIPVRKGDTVRVVRGNKSKKNGKDLKVIGVYRKKYCIHLEGLTTDKNNGTSVQVPIHTSNVVVTDLYMNGSRQSILNRKNRANGNGKKAALD